MNRAFVTLSSVALAATFCLTGQAVASDVEAGKAIYDVNCASCHGMTGKGDGPISAALTPKPRDFSTGEFKLDANKSGAPGQDEDLALVIKKGAMNYGGSPLMAPWPTLSDEQVNQLIVYIHSLKAQ